MKVKKEETVEYKIRNRVKNIKSNVILRKDVADIGNYRQISSGLKRLVDQKELVRIGLGIYAKAYCSNFKDIILIKGGVDVTLREGLDRLNVKWEPSRDEISYNQGKTTQVPVKNIVRLKSRCRRKIGYHKSVLIFEDKTNAR